MRTISIPFTEYIEERKRYEIIDRSLEEAKVAGIVIIETEKIFGMVDYTVTTTNHAINNILSKMTIKEFLKARKASRFTNKGRELNEMV